MHNLKYFKILKKFTSAMAKFFCLIFSFKLSRKFDRCTAIAANVTMLYAGGEIELQNFKISTKDDRKTNAQ